MDEILRLDHLEKTFGTHQVLRDISFSVNKGDVISIIGSSGSVWRQTDVVIGRHGRRDAVKIFLRAGLQRFDVVHKVAVFRFKVERV